MKDVFDANFAGVSHIFINIHYRAEEGPPSEHPFPVLCHISYNLLISLSTGSGLSLCFNPAASIVPEYFIRHRSLAISLSATGLGAGQIIFPPLVQYLVHEYGWRGGLLMIAALNLHTVLYACLLRPVSAPESASESKTVDAEELNCKESSLSVKGCNIMQTCNLFLMKNFYFDLFLIHNFLFGLALSIAFVHMGAYAIEVGLTHDEATTLFLICGIANTLARPLSGILTKIFSPVVLHVVATGLYSICLFIFPFSRGYVIFAMITTFMGLAFGIIGPSVFQVTLQIMGLWKLASAFGYVCLASAIGLLIGAPLAGKIFNRLYLDVFE